MKDFFKTHKWIILVLLICAWQSVIQFHLFSISWDAADYVLMGKYLFSFGKAGYWAAHRGIGWPLILGLSWRSGLDPVMSGRVVGVGLGLGALFLLYLVGERVFNRKSAALAALFLSSSPLYFFYGQDLLHHIPTVFFALLALVLFMRKKIFLAGLSCGWAFLMRYTQGLLFLALFLLCLEEVFLKRNFRAARDLTIGFCFFLIPLFILNFFIYRDVFYFLRDGMSYSRMEIEGYNSGQMFYLKQLIGQSPFLFLFFLVGVFQSLKERRREGLFLLCLGGVFFLFYQCWPIQEKRYLIEVVPFFCLFSAYGVERTFDRSQSRYIRAVMIFLVVFVVSAFFIKTLLFPRKAFHLSPIQKYAAGLRGPVKGEVWTTNPAYVAFCNLKIARSLYSINQVEEAGKNIGAAGLVFFNSSDVYRPGSDQEAEKKMSAFFEALKRDFSVECRSEDSLSASQAVVFRRR